MADIYQVRVKAIRDEYLTCHVVELYPDSGLYASRTLVLHLLWDTVDGRTTVLNTRSDGNVAWAWRADNAQSSALGLALAGRYAHEDGDWNWENVGRFISCVGVVEPFEGIADLYYNDSQGEWQRGRSDRPMPQATFHIAATDPQWFAHLAPGMAWISRGFGEDTYARFRSSWLTSDVLALARGIDDEQAFDRMPILADALQDAGCDSDDILTHLRDPHATHVRGCWALDLVLGKE